MVPATSVIYAPYGDSVYLVEEKRTIRPRASRGRQAGSDEAAAPAKAADGKPGLIARQQFVRLGERRGDYVAVPRRPQGRSRRW